MKLTEQEVANYLQAMKTTQEEAARIVETHKGSLDLMEIAFKAFQNVASVVVQDNDKTIIIKLK